MDEALKKIHAKLMARVLNGNISPRARARAFEKIYYDYVSKMGNDNGWDDYRILLRRRHEKLPSKRCQETYGLDAKSLRRAHAGLKRNIPGGEKMIFPAPIFYNAGYSVIRKLMGRGATILEIGCGDDPAFIRLLNEQGYSAYGIEPFSKRCDRGTTFRATVRNIPEALRLKYDFLLANMVYCVYYTYTFSERFSWELRHKKTLLEKMFSLLRSGGYLMLVDDVGTIFSREELARFARVILYEHDLPPVPCDGIIIEGVARVTLLRKRDKRRG